MTRDYDSKNPIVNPLLIQKIKEARQNTDDKVFLDFLTELFEAEFLMPIESNYTGSDSQLFDVMLLQNADGIYIPIFTNYFEMRKLNGTKKNQKILVTDFYDTIDLVFMLEEVGAAGIVIDPFGINLSLSLDFIEGAEQIIQTQKQKKMIKEMHNLLLNSETNDTDSNLDTDNH